MPGYLRGVYPSVEAALIRAFAEDERWRYTDQRPTPVSSTDRIRYADISLSSGSTTGSEVAPWGRSQLDTLVLAGDIVYLKGTSPLGWSLRPPVNGTSTDWVVYDLWPGEDVTIMGTSNGPEDPGAYPTAFLDDRDYISLQNITLDGQTQDSNDALFMIRFSGSDYIYIKNCIVHCNTGLSGVGGALGGNYQFVEGCYIHGHGTVEYSNAGDGIGFGYYAAANHCVAYNNTILEFGHAGFSSILAGFDLTGMSTNDEIYCGFNYISSQIAAGIAIHTTSNYWVQGNVCKDIAVDYTTEWINPNGGGTGVPMTWYGTATSSPEGLVLGGFNATVSYNVVENARGFGIYIKSQSYASVPQHCSTINVFNNVVTRCWGCPLALGMAGGDTYIWEDVNVYNNIFFDNHTWDPMTMDLFSGPRPLSDLDSSFAYYSGKFWNIWVSLAHLESNESSEATWMPGGVHGFANTTFRNCFVPVEAQGEEVGFLFHNPNGGYLNASFDTEADAITGLVEKDIADNEEGLDPQFLSVTYGDADYLRPETDSPVVDAGIAVVDVDYAGLGMDCGIWEVA